MIEIAVLLSLVGVALAVFLVAAVSWFLVKLVFKVVLFPITLALLAVKVVGMVLLGLFALVVAPVVLTVLAIVAIPLLILAAIVGLGFAVVGFAF